MTALQAMALAAVAAGAPTASAGERPALSTPSDPRAEFVDENIRNCADAGYPDDVQIYGEEAEDGGDAYVEATGTGTQPTKLNVAITDEGEAAGVVIDAVVIKGGEGSNIYKAPNVPPDLEPPQNYQSPTNDGGNVADISHYLVCYHFDDQPDVPQGALLVLKRVSAPEGGTEETLPASYSVDVECTPPTGAPVTDTVTFGTGGGIGTTSSGGLLVQGIPDGSTCTVTETGTDAFPEGTQVTYLPADAPTGIVTEAGIGTTVVIENDFSGTEPATGSFTVTKAVVPPPYGPVPSTFTVDYVCQDGTKGQLELSADESATVDGIRADSYCYVVEPPGSLPEGWDVEYAVDGRQSTSGELFRVGDDASVQVLVTNDGSDAPNPPLPPDKDK